MQLAPYLFFEGRAQEAADFYVRMLGAKINMAVKYKDGPQPCPPGMDEKIMHMNLSIGETTLLLSDSHNSGNVKFEGFALSFTVSSVAEAEKIFNALADGGKVQMPLGKTFFSAAFGMIHDKFGVFWMVYVAS